MHECTGRIRRFRFNLPQRIAAVFLAFFLFQGMWLLSRNPDGAEAAAACGRALWLHPLTVNSPACSAMQAGPLVYRLAILPLLVHLPFLAIAFVMGGALWWVTRRQYGNLGGYTALAFCCFSPVLLRKIIQPDGGIPGTLGVYAGIQIVDRWADYPAGAFMRVHALGAHFEIGVVERILVRQPPVGGHAGYDVGVGTVVGLGRSGLG